MSSSSSAIPFQSSPDSNLPIREIPGSYSYGGSSFFGAIRDRYDYFYNEGQDNFFLNKMHKYNSTVFRTNMPPGPFISKDSRVVVLLDAVSFPVLFDTSKVEKKNVLDGTFMPSTAFFGGHRPCAFLDTSEPGHETLKAFFLSLLARLHTRFIPLFRSSLCSLFDNLENQVSQNGKAGFNPASDEVSFEFVFRLFCNKSPSETELGDGGAKLMDSWIAFQLSPLISLGLKFLPNFLEDLLLHTFSWPFFAVKPGYEKLRRVFGESATSVLDEAEKNGVKRDEAVHNLVFLAGFNAYGGMKALFPSLIKWVGAAGENLHRRLANEIRTIVNEDGGGVTLTALEKMKLTKSVVYEVLRIEPPVPYQYGKARDDIIVRSHESSFLIKKGEMIFGYQPFATKDPKVFTDPEKFIPDRFLHDGEKLIHYIYWSNDRETKNPAAGDKQCPAKELVVLMARLMLVELFLRYDSYEIQWEKLPLGSSVTITAFTKHNVHKNIGEF
ncbi:PREDICTED: allene oxide synthase 3-like isoform X2 [Ipomoea nil]|uniref:allene oxide synthase 3-like isoform X2 n=1 Tax=Ipomoea nil TaxID=35883 RepID=UPI000900D207|nr:PREDICTED: allene oxide synthase 3-like isoform X2 [Ipomoea nil]